MKSGFFTDDYVDFHTHLDLYPDPAAAIKKCDSRRVATLTVTTTPRAFPRNCELAADSPFVRVALGLHPQLVAERAGEIEIFERLLPTTRYVGEIGLDAGPRHYRSFELQKKVFGAILRLCAKAGGKILSVHSVRSSKHVLDLVEQCLPVDRGKVVLHWFMGSPKDTQRGVRLGCYYSVNEQMLASPNGRRVLEEIPEDRLLTETDGPFVKRDGEAIGPGDVQCAVELLSELTGRSIATVRRQVTANLRSLIVT